MANPSPVPELPVAASRLAAGLLAPGSWMPSHLLATLAVRLCQA